MRGTVDLGIRLDTPLLQGGPEPRKPDGTARIRIPSVRGLIHTFARAIIGPILGGDAAGTRQLEIELLGAAGTENSTGTPTFRMQDQTEYLLGTKLYPNCPHDPGGRGDRKGHPPEVSEDRDREPTVGMLGIPLTAQSSKARCQIRVQLRPRLVFPQLDAALFGALWATVWTAFSFGSFGARARRGYGSCTICEAAGAPEVDGVLLPTFDGVPSRSALRQKLSDGLDHARAAIRNWAATPALNEQPAMGGFFQLEESYLGREIKEAPSSWGEGAMIRIMSWCHQNKNTPGYRDQMGSASPRHASPCWIRLYRTTGGFTPLVTYSPSATMLGTLSGTRLVDSLISHLGGDPI